MKKVKFKCEIYCEAKAKCGLCGKQFEGDNRKVERKLLIHALARHPVHSIKVILGWLKEREKNG